MPKLGDGNERDVRIRPSALPISPSGNPCGPASTQTDLIPAGSVVETPSSTVRLAYDWTDVSKLCPKGIGLFDVTKIVTQILKSHFSDPSQYFDPDLSGLIYNPDHTKTSLRIVQNTTLDFAGGGSTQAIVVKRAEQASERVVIGDFAEDHASDPESEYGQRYVRMVRGVHKLLALSAVDGEAELLAQEIWTLFHCVSPIVRSILPFHDFEPIQVGEIGLLDEVGSVFAVPIALRYTYEFGWKMTPTKPPIENISIRVTTTD